MSLQFTLFGSMSITRIEDSTGEVLGIKLTRLAQALLAFLILHRQRTHTRDDLTDLFWGERGETHARGCLSTTLWRLRRQLEPQARLHGAYLDVTPHGHIRFRWANNDRIDVDAFEREMTELLTRPIEVNTLTLAQIAKLKSALALYTNDLLVGFFDDWALRERERLRRMYLNGLHLLMEHAYLNKAYAEAVEYGQQILAHDPLREEVHRVVMRSYAESGQRALAAQQFLVCRDALNKEMSIAPMQETEELYLCIVSTQTRPKDADFPSLVEQVNAYLRMQQLNQQLCVAATMLDDVRAQLQHTINTLRAVSTHLDQSTDDLTVR